MIMPNHDKTPNVLSYVFETANILITRAEIERDKNDRFRY